MKRQWSWLCVLLTLLLLKVTTLANPPVPAPQPAAADGQDRELQSLLERVAELGNLITKNPQSPDAWKHQLAQGEITLQIAGRSKGKERETWLRVAIDSFYGAAAEAPEKERSAGQRLAELPALITRSFPDCPLAAYAALQEIQVDYGRMLTKSGDNPAKAQEHLRNRLIRFAEENPRVPETPKTIYEAGQLSEQIGKVEDARHCYRYLDKHYANHPMARKAQAALWRLTAVNQPVNFRLDRLYASGNDTQFDIKELRGKVVIVYFWSSATPSIVEDFRSLQRIAERYNYRTLEVVYVNLDNDKSKVQSFLFGRLPEGLHLCQAGGLESPVVQSFRIDSLPYALVINRDGKLLQHSIPVSRVESVLSSDFASER